MVDANITTHLRKDGNCVTTSQSSRCFPTFFLLKTFLFKEERNSSSNTNGCDDGHQQVRKGKTPCQKQQNPRRKRASSTHKRIRKVESTSRMKWTTAYFICAATNFMCDVKESLWKMKKNSRCNDVQVPKMVSSSNQDDHLWRPVVVPDDIIRPSDGQRSVLKKRNNIKREEIRITWPKILVIYGQLTIFGTVSIWLQFRFKRALKIAATHRHTVLSANKIDASFDLISISLSFFPKQLHRKRVNGCTEAIFPI